MTDGTIKIKEKKTSTTRTRQKKLRRKPPNPQNSILDRNALLEELDNVGITIKPMHIDAFYQALHRMHYPPIKEFVSTYYKNEHKDNITTTTTTTTRETTVETTNTNTTNTTTTTNNNTNTNNATTTTITNNNNNNDNNNNKVILLEQLPNKNKISNKKCKNRKQLPKKFLDFLITTNKFVTVTSKIKQQLTSKDNSTTKLVIELYDGQIVESVLMRYNKKGSGRASLCVSSQCGCAMGCTFCATGTMGLSGNLSTAEILEQLVHADHILGTEYIITNNNNNKENDQNNNKTTKHNNNNKNKNLDLVRNVVFMGMGEPLDNYNNVIEACKSMMDRRRWNLAHGRVTVSTVGLISQIRKLTKDLPEVSLALSLHAPNQKARTEIVPTASKYPIEKLIDALDNHMMAYLMKRQTVQQQQQQQNNNNNNTNNNNNVQQFTKEERIKESTRRRAMIEYVMLQGETSSFECAHQLGKLCENRHLVVNLIPYNATDVKDKLQCPSENHMQQFRDIVASYGSFCTIRRTMGADIASACGQLVTKEQQQQQQQENTTNTNNQNQNQQQQQSSTIINDIEDVIRNPNKNVTTTTTTTTKKGNNINSNNNDKEKGGQSESDKMMLRTTTATTTNKDLSKSSSTDNNNNTYGILKSISTEDLDKLSQRLTIASTIAASCFVMSSIVFLTIMKKKK